MDVHAPTLVEHASCPQMHGCTRRTAPIPIFNANTVCSNKQTHAGPWMDTLISKGLHTMMELCNIDAQESSVVWRDARASIAVYGVDALQVPATHVYPCFH